MSVFQNYQQELKFIETFRQIFTMKIDKQTQPELFLFKILASAWKFNTKFKNDIFVKTKLTFCLKPNF